MFHHPAQTHLSQHPFLLAGRESFYSKLLGDLTSAGALPAHFQEGLVLERVSICGNHTKTENRTWCSLLAYSHQPNCPAYTKQGKWFLNKDYERSWEVNFNLPEFLWPKAYLFDYPSWFLPLGEACNGWIKKYRLTTKKKICRLFCLTIKQE